MSKRKPEFETVEDAYGALLRHHSVYGATTIHLNGTLERHWNVPSKSAAIDSAKGWLKELFLQCDRAFHRTPDVISKISADDRLHALVVVEKAGVSTHLHIAWFLKNKIEKPVFYESGALEEIKLQWDIGMRWFHQCREIASRKNFVLSAFNDARATIREEDKKFCEDVKRFGASGWELDPIARTLKGCSVQSHGVYDQERWLEYLSKEHFFDRDFTDQMIFSDDFFGSAQRKDPTRYWRFKDRDKRVKILDLDRPLKPIK